MKIMGRILLVLLITIVLATGIYFLVNGTTTSSSTAIPSQGNHPALQEGSKPQNDQLTQSNDGSGFRGGDREGGNNTGWLDLLKNAGIFLGAGVVVFGLQKLIHLINKKRTLANSPV
jgi:hypothetical protein